MSHTKQSNSSVDNVILQIAKKHLRIEALEAKNSEPLDWHDCHVSQIEKALHAAYEAGFEAGSVATTRKGK